MRGFSWWHNRQMPALLAVSSVLQAVAQTTPPLGAAQIVPFRSTTTWSPTLGSSGGTGEKEGGKTGMVWLQFVNTDIATVARSLGVMTGRQVLVDTRVEGTLNLQSIQAVSPSVAWDMFAQALNEKNSPFFLRKACTSSRCKSSPAAPQARTAKKKQVR